MKRFSFILCLALFLAGCKASPDIAANQSSQQGQPDLPSDQPTAPPDSSGQPSTPAAPNPDSKGGSIPKEGERTIPFKDMPPDLQKNFKAIAQSQQREFKIAPPASANWSAAPQRDRTAAFVAAKLQQSISQLTDTSGKISVAYESPDGNGQFQQDLRVKDPTKFHVPFIVVGDAPLACNVVSNGKLKLVQYGPEWRDRAPVTSNSKAYTPERAPAVTWPRDFTQMVYQPLTHTQVSWPDIVKTWLKGDQGYSLTVEARKVPMQLTNPHTGATQEYDAPEIRLYAKRDDKGAAKYGASEIEVVIDGYRWLPTTIRSIYSDTSGKKTWRINWGCHYYFKQSFAKSDFLAPFSAVLKAK